MDPRLHPGDALRTTHPGDWGLVQRSIDSSFHPARSMITEEGRTQTALRQLGNGPAPADTPPGRQLPPDDNVELQESVEAAQRAYERPVSSRWAEVTAVTAADGRLVSVTLSLISGNPRFDEAALAAVRKGLLTRPPAEERRSMQSRWLVRGAVAVILPRAVAPMVPRASNGRVPVRAVPFPMPFASTFDESTGRARVQPAGSDKIETEVKLLSLQPVAE
jgi:hypothetical protein